MILETERLMLRYFTLEDSKRVSTIVNNYNIYKYTLNIPYPYDENMAKDWISLHEENRLNDKSYEFAITLKDTKEVIGVIGISSDQNTEGELGYWLNEDYWNHGYVTEAAHEILKYVFEHKGYTKVYSRYLSKNIASGRVMQKLGMTQVIKDPKTIEKDGKVYDLIHYELNKEDFK